MMLGTFSMLSFIDEATSLGANVGVNSPSNAFIPTSSDPNAPQFGITLDRADFYLTEIGDSVQLSASLSILNANAQEITWSSSDETIITVDQNGFITPVYPGTATITAMSVFGVYETVQITIPRPPVTSVEIGNRPANNEIIVDAPSHQLTVTVLPTFAYDREVEWVSSHPQYATVSPTGQLVAVTAGQTTITARTPNGTYDSFPLSVRYPLPASVVINYRPSGDTLVVDQVHALTSTVLPSNAVPREVTWSSSNHDIAVISSTGTITAIDAGTTTITATVGGIVTDSFELTVRWPFPQTITINNRPAGDRLIVGQSHTLGNIIHPPEAQPRVVEWNSSNTGVASINQYGTITPISAGTTTIRATVIGHPNVTQYFTLHVDWPAPTQVVVNNPPGVALIAGGSNHHLTATVHPLNAQPRTVRWYSTNPAVATVNVYTGAVTPNAQGDTVIIARVNNNVYATFVLNVVWPAPSGVYIWNLPAGNSMLIGERRSLQGYVLTSQAQPRWIEWTSSNPAVATIHPQTGEIHASRIPNLTPVTVTFTATAYGVSNSVQITIHPRQGWVSSQPGPQGAVNVRSSPVLSNFNPDNRLRHIFRGYMIWIIADANYDWWGFHASPQYVHKNYVSLTPLTPLSAILPAALYSIFDALDVEEQMSAMLNYLPNEYLVQVEVCRTEVTLPMFTTDRLTATVSPTPQSYGLITWSSANADVASVTADGTVTANMPGTAMIIGTIGPRSSVAIATVGTSLPPSTLAITHDVAIPHRFVSRRQPILLDTTITSNYYITSARAFIVRAETGAVVRSESTNFLGTKEFHLANSPVCRFLGIHFLPNGNFYFVLEATDQMGTQELQRTPFQVRTTDPIVWVNPPAIPTVITHGDEINLQGYLTSWTYVTNVRSYFINRDNNQQLQQFSQAVTAGQNIFQLASSVICENAIFANLLPGRYTFVIRGSNDYGEDLVVRYVHFFVVPQAPANLAVSGVNHEGVTLTWDSVVGATNYRIYHGDGRLAGVTQDTSITLRGLAENTPFVFVVVATSAGGDSAPSNPASIHTNYAPPLPPTGLTVRSTTDTTASLEWIPNPLATQGYRIYANGIFQGSTNSANETTFTVTGLKSNTQHTFTIVAVGTGGASPASPTATAWTLPSAPTDGGAVDVTHHSLRLTWRASYGIIIGYRIYLNGTIFGTTAGNVTHLDIRDLAPHTHHNFTIVAVGAGGYSLHSNIIPVQTRSRPPENLRHNNVNHNSATLIWDAVDGAVSYRVYDANGRLLGTTYDTSLAVSGLIPNSQQLLTVVAVDTFGNPSGHSIPTVFHTLVGAVTNLLSTDATSNSARLTWLAPLGGATEYRIYLNGNLISITQNRHFDLDSLAPNTQHTFAVRAVGFTGDSLLTTEVQFWTAPRYPSPIYARDLRHNFVAIEFRSSVGGASYYRHYLNGRFVGTTQNATGVMRFDFTGLQENTLYTLTTVAVGYGAESLGGGIRSAPTDLVVRTPFAPPSPPTNLSFSGTTHNSTILHWVASTGNVSGYRIYRANGSLVGTTSGQFNTSLPIRNLAHSTNHTFFVVAIGAGGRSERSATATERTLLPPAPSRPTGLGFSGTTHNSTTLIWSAVSGYVTGYRVYRANGTFVGSTTGRNSTRLTITGLTPATSYGFFVVATGPGGRSFPSETATERTLTTPPPQQPPPNQGGGGSNALPTRITVPDQEIVVAIGRPHLVIPNLQPNNAINSSVTWTATGGVSVEPSGANGVIIRGNSVTSYARVTGTTSNGLTVIIHVRVYDPNNPEFWAMELRGGGPVVVGTTRQLVVTQRYEGRNFFTLDSVNIVQWESRDPRIATVSSNGVLTAHRVGDVLIYAIAPNGAEIVRLLRVVATPPVQPQRVDINMGGRIYPPMRLCSRWMPLWSSATVYPRQADQTVTWRSSDESVFTIEVIDGRYWIYARGFGHYSYLYAVASNGVQSQPIPFRVIPGVVPGQPADFRTGQWDYLYNSTYPPPYQYFSSFDFRLSGRFTLVDYSMDFRFVSPSLAAEILQGMRDELNNELRGIFSLFLFHEAQAQLGVSIPTSELDVAMLLVKKVAPPVYYAYITYKLVYNFLFRPIMNLGARPGLTVPSGRYVQVTALYRCSQGTYLIFTRYIHSEHRRSSISIPWTMITLGNNPRADFNRVFGGGR